MSEKSNARGIAIMILSMAAFAVADTLVKVSASFMSPPQVLFHLMGGGLIMFVGIALIRKERLGDRRAFAPILLLRYASEIAGMFGMVLALSYVPLSTVGAITQATPILVAIGAVLFLGEKVSWRRWSAIAVGFAGVVLIIQPGGEDFDLAILWALLAMVSLSVRDLTTRLTPVGMPSASLATYTMIAAMPFSIGWIFLNGESFVPEESDWLIVLPMIVLGSIGYMLLIASIRMADVSAVTPFRYSRIVFLLGLGIIVFDERPGVPMLCGAFLIIVSGIYMMWREQRVKKSTAD